jgi:hypothetical protein
MELLGSLGGEIDSCNGSMRVERTALFGCSRRFRLAGRRIMVRIIPTFGLKKGRRVASDNNEGIAAFLYLKKYYSVSVDTIHSFFEGERIVGQFVL